MLTLPPHTGEWRAFATVNTLSATEMLFVDGTKYCCRDVYFCCGPSPHRPVLLSVKEGGGGWARLTATVYYQHLTIKNEL